MHILKNLLRFSIKNPIILVPGAPFWRSLERLGPKTPPESRGTSRKLPRDLPGTSKTSQEGPKRRPRATQGSQKLPKSTPREPKDYQKASNKNVGGAPKHKKGDLQQTLLLIVFELHKCYPGTPGDAPKIIKKL